MGFQLNQSPSNGKLVDGSATQQKYIALEVAELNK